jgi:uncharacterized phosphosugar-binding protein
MGEHELKQVAVEISIRIMSNGQITVHGPLHDKILCYGVLDAAKDVVRNHKVEQKNILVPQIMVPNGIKGN